MHRIVTNAPRAKLITATLIAWLCVVSPCSAAFSNLWLVSYECQPAELAGYRVWRVYARFTNPGDRLVSVFGSPASPLTITSTTGGFYQDPHGGHTAPDEWLIGKWPSLQWDTFCTLGLSRDAGDDLTGTTPGFPPLPVSSHTNMGWYVPLLATNQNAPDSAGFVLILQLTLPPGAFLGAVNVGLEYRPSGSPGTVTVNNATPVLVALTAGDVDADLQVNIDDLLLVINTWGGSGEGIADATDDGAVDIDDLLMVLNHWGLSPCP